MAIAIGQHKSAGTAAFSPVTSLTTAAPAGNTTTGSTFVIMVFTGGTVAASTPVQDSFSNTYTLKASAAVIFGAQHVYCYVCPNGTGGASHTATVNFSASASGGIFFAEVTGAATSSYDTSGTISNNGAGATQSGASVTTTNANDLILSMLCTNGTGDTITDSTGWNQIIESMGFGAGGAANGALSYIVESATGTYSDTYGISGASDATGGVTVALKAGSGGGSVQIPAPIDPTFMPRRAPQIDIFRNNAAFLFVAPAQVPQPIIDPVTWKPRYSIDLYPNVATSLRLSLGISTDFYQRSAPKPLPIDLYPNLAVLAQPPARTFQALDIQVQRRPPAQPDLYPNIAALSVPPAIIIQAPIDPQITRKSLQVDLYPNIALRAPPTTVLINEPIEPWVNKRYPPQIDLYPNIVARVSVEPPQQFPTIDFVNFRRTIQSPEIFPNVAINAPKPAGTINPYQVNMGASFGMSLGHMGGSVLT